MTLQEIEDAIVAQCELRKAEGWTIVGGTYGNSVNRTCCPMSSFGNRVVWSKAGGSIPDLDMDQSSFLSFVRGFDCVRGYPSSEHYLLGIRVRERLGL